MKTTVYFYSMTSSNFRMCVDLSQFGGFLISSSILFLYIYYAHIYICIHRKNHSIKIFQL